MLFSHYHQRLHTASYIQGQLWHSGKSLGQGATIQGLVFQRFGLHPSSQKQCNLLPKASIMWLKSSLAALFLHQQLLTALQLCAMALGLPCSLKTNSWLDAENLGKQGQRATESVLSHQIKRHTCSVSKQSITEMNLYKHRDKDMKWTSLAPGDIKNILLFRSQNVHLTNINFKPAARGQFG